MNCDHCQKEIPLESTVCPYCYIALTDPAVEPEIIEPTGANPYAAPLTNPPPAPAQPGSLHSEGDSTGGIIPYKNPKALLAYYLGIVSGFPLLGFPIGIAAFILGILGLRDRKRNPVIKGSLHAWIGIGCGGLFTLFWGFVIVVIIVGVVSDM